MTHTRAESPIHEIWIQEDSEEPASVRKARIHGRLITTASNPGQSSPNGYGGRGIAAYEIEHHDFDTAIVLVLDADHQLRTLRRPEELAGYFWGADLAEAFDALGEPLIDIGE